MKNLVFILFFFCLLSNAKTITVGKTYPVKTIKQAITLANDGDTIIVTPGVYKEGNLIIQKYGQGLRCCNSLGLEVLLCGHRTLSFQ